jgi:hypothetical protein
VEASNEWECFFGARELAVRWERGVGARNRRSMASAPGSVASGFLSRRNPAWAESPHNRRPQYPFKE